MRIDSAIPPLENQSTSQVGNSGSSGPSSRASAVPSGQDQAQLSVDSGTVQTLKARLGQTPEIRQDRVNALRQAISDGTYQVSDRQLSDAIGSALLGTESQLS